MKYERPIWKRSWKRRSEHLLRHQDLQHAPVDLRVLADGGVGAEHGVVGFADEDRRLAELERLRHRRGDGLDHVFQVDASLELVAEADEPAQKLDLAALCLPLRRAQVHGRDSPPCDAGSIMSSTSQCTATSAARVLPWALRLPELSTLVGRRRRGRSCGRSVYDARGGSWRICRASSGVAGSRSSSRPRRTTRCTSCALLSASTPFW